MADARVDAKVVLIGDAAVGKTSLVVRFLHDRFDTTLPTVGASYATKQVTLRDAMTAATNPHDFKIAVRAAGLEG